MGRWTTDKPTVPGWYWRRTLPDPTDPYDEPLDGVVFVRVLDTGISRTPVVFIDVLMNAYRRVDEMDALWYGPLTPPDEKEGE